MVAQQVVNFGGVPNVELAFLALAVGIEGTGEGEASVATVAADLHLPERPFNGFADAHLVEGVAGFPPGLAQEVDEESIVVEHLLEMRRQPSVVRRIAGEATAQVVVDAALAQVVEGYGDRLAIDPGAVAPIGPPQEPEERRLRKLRRPGGAAEDRVDDTEGAAGAVVEAVDGQAGAGGGRRHLVQGLAKRRHVLSHLVALAAVGV